MEYSPSFHTNCLLRLSTAREVLLRALEQRRTYGGLVAGIPDSGTNDRLIENALSRARKTALGKDPLLIPPNRREFLREPGDMELTGRRRTRWPVEQRRTPEFLPHIECIGLFFSGVARDRSKNGSELTILWYQDRFGIEDSAIERLRSIDWDAHAADCDYD